MHDVVHVRMVERRGDGHARWSTRAAAATPHPTSPTEAAAGHVLHDQVEVLVLREHVEQRVTRFGWCSEAMIRASRRRRSAVVSRHFRAVQPLDCDLAPQALVLGQEDRRRSAGAQAAAPRGSGRRRASPASRCAVVGHPFLLAAQDVRVGDQEHAGVSGLQSMRMWMRITLPSGEERSCTRSQSWLTR